MAKTVYKANGNGRFCNLTISSLEQGPEAIAIHELSSGGARLELLQGVLTPHEYVDVAIDLGGGSSQSLFGHVLQVRGDEAVLRWLFFDAAEEEERRIAEALRQGLTGNPRVEVVEGAISPEERVDADGRRDNARRQTAAAVRRGATASDAAGDVRDPAGGTADSREEQGSTRSGRKPRKGAVLPSQAAARERYEDDDVPVGGGRALVSKVVTPLDLPEADSPEEVPEIGDARRITAAIRRRGETDGGPDGERRSSKKLSATAPASGVRRAVRPQQDDRGAGTGEGERPARSQRVVKPSKGSVPQPAPAVPANELRRVVKPSKDARPAQLPVPEEPRRPQSTRMIVKPRRMRVKDMPTLARPMDESADDTPRPIELIDQAVAEADAKRGAAAPRPRRPRRPRDAVSRRILSKTRKVDLTDLAARQKTVRVVNLETIKGLIQDAVDEVVGTMSPVEVLDEEAMARAVEEKVAERLQSAEHEKRDLEAKARGLEVQLKAAQRALEEEREREISATDFTVSETGLEDLEKHFNRLVQHAIRANGVGDALARELERMVGTLLDKERERIAEKALKAHEGKMGMLQKQIERLARSLEETEQERDINLKRLKIMEAQGGGLANIMEAGLDLEDPDAERKRALLKEVFELNKQLREEYRAAHGGALPESKRVAIRAEAERQAQEALRELEAGHGQESAPDDASDEASDPYGNMTNPDDEVWDGPASTADGEADAGDADEDPYADMADPDDMIWEGPSETFEQQQATKGQGDIKLMTSYKDFEPPPLERQKD